MPSWVKFGLDKIYGLNQAFLKTSSNPVSMVSTRLRLSEGQVSAYVLRANGDIDSSSKNIQITIACSEPLKVGSKNSEHKVRFRGNEVKMIFRNDMATLGHIKRVTVSDSNGDNIVMELTPVVAKKPYLGLETKHDFDSVTVDISL